MVCCSTTPQEGDLNFLTKDIKNEAGETAQCLRAAVLVEDLSLIPSSDVVDYIHL